MSLHTVTWQTGADCDRRRYYFSNHTFIHNFPCLEEPEHICVSVNLRLGTPYLQFHLLAEGIAQSSNKLASTQQL